MREGTGLYSGQECALPKKDGEASIADTRGRGLLPYPFEYSIQLRTPTAPASAIRRLPVPGCSG